MTRRTDTDTDTAPHGADTEARSMATDTAAERVARRRQAEAEALAAGARVAARRAVRQARRAEAEAHAAHYAALTALAAAALREASGGRIGAEASTTGAVVADYVAAAWCLVREAAAERPRSARATCLPLLSDAPPEAGASMADTARYLVRLEARRRQAGAWCRVVRDAARTDIRRARTADATAADRAEAREAALRADGATWRADRDQARGWNRPRAAAAEALHGAWSDATDTEARSNVRRATRSADSARLPMPGAVYAERGGIRARLDTGGALAPIREADTAGAVRLIREAPLEALLTEALRVHADRSEADHAPARIGRRAARQAADAGITEAEVPSRVRYAARRILDRCDALRVPLAALLAAHADGAEVHYTEACRALAAAPVAPGIDAPDTAAHDDYRRALTALAHGWARRYLAVLAHYTDAPLVVDDTAGARIVATGALTAERRKGAVVVPAWSYTYTRETARGGARKGARTRRDATAERLAPTPHAEREAERLAHVRADAKRAEAEAHATTARQARTAPTTGAVTYLRRRDTGAVIAVRFAAQTRRPF